MLKPLLVGSGFAFLGLLLLSLTFLPNVAYIISSIIGYLLFGIGLGTYATPSTDTAVAEAPDDKVGVASGLYKMASSLGNAFGVAMSEYHLWFWCIIHEFTTRRRCWRIIQCRNCFNCIYSNFNFSS